MFLAYSIGIANTLKNPLYFQSKFLPKEQIKCFNLLRMMYLKSIFNYVSGFGLISLIALCIDVALFQILLYFELKIFWASCISIVAAITFTYHMSARRLFSNSHRFLIKKFSIYAIYHFTLMIIVSGIISVIHKSQIPIISHPLSLKFILLPFTFCCNAVVTFLLLKNWHSSIIVDCASFLNLGELSVTYIHR